MLQSKTYEVLDCLWLETYDSSTITTRWALPSTISLSYSNDEVTISTTETSGSRFAQIKINNSTNWYDSTKDYCFEADIVTYDNSGGGIVSIVCGGAGRGFNLISNPQGKKLTVKIIDGVLSYYVNGTHTGEDPTTSTSGGFSVQLFKACSVTMKNVKIYPI